MREMEERKMTFEYMLSKLSFDALLMIVRLRIMERM
jgi:hypothetical protein